MSVCAGSFFVGKAHFPFCNGSVDSMFQKLRILRFTAKLVISEICKIN